ncbi:uncharacterized protein G2W53_007043 [Senna tora]|uniref:Uncharacterized protein n=1 Tax=Senna tora TaxID=362788 RepID=A0A835CEK1_9FABA|nr:uncharacterized protein G2W53_007043 [Senna tora]
MGQGDGRTIDYEAIVRLSIFETVQ